MNDLELLMMALVRYYLRPSIKIPDHLNLNVDIRFEEVDQDYVTSLGIEDMCVEVEDKILQPLCVIYQNNKRLISDPEFYRLLKVLVDHERSKHGDTSLKSIYSITIPGGSNLGQDIASIKSLKNISKIVGPEKTKTLLNWIADDKSQNKGQ